MADKGEAQKLKRKFISLEKKIQILDRLKKGEKVSAVSKDLELNEATVRTIHKNESKIRNAVAAGTSTSLKFTVRKRPQIIEKMEKSLSLWIDECCQKKIPLDGNIIKEKSLKIYQQLQAKGESSSSLNFVASNGWFEKFKKRHNLHNIKIQGEAASADIDGAKEFPKKLEAFIKEKNYSVHQVFNADETALWWKKMPDRTFISKDERVAPGFKASKDRLTLLLCSNASGDFSLKPMLVYKSLNPRALKSINKDTLPVFWTANSKAWVTAKLFEHWFRNSFVPQVEIYLKTKNLDFKALLIIDNAPGHPQNLSHPNIEIIFLPPNTTSLIQPLDQGIINNFKTYYIKRSLQWILDTTEEQSIDVKEAWKQFNIKNCIEIVDLSLKDVKKTTLNRCWRKLWPAAVEEQSMSTQIENEIDSVLRLAHTINGEGMADMNAEDVQQLLTEDLDDEFLLLSDIEQSESDDQSNEDTDVESFTIEKLNKGFQLAKELEQYFEQLDPSLERKLKFKRALNACLSPYNELHKNLTNNQVQPKITTYFQKKEASDDGSVDSDDIPLSKRRFLVISSDEES